jgi:tRNA G10  N-methylase Trm11
LHLYTYTFHEDERDLCTLELRTLFGFSPAAQAFLADTRIDASRSPFVKERIDVRCEGRSLAELSERVRREAAAAGTFKVEFVKTGEPIPYAERLHAESVVGRAIRGTADMRVPDIRYGLARYGERWLFGERHRNHSPWLRHNEKAQHYSTALSTKMARAVANIAVPRPEGVQAIDPCCGIGTVVVEALSMGIHMVGSDANPLAAMGARENLSRFGFPNVITLADARTLSGNYDAVVLDLPYNIASRLSGEERDGLLRAAFRLAPRAVIVSVEPIEAALGVAGWQIEDRCMARKGSFRREVFLCVREI